MKNGGPIALNWLLVGAYCFLLIIVSSISTPKLMPDVAYSDKFLHFAAFVVLAILFMRAFRSLSWGMKRWLVVSATLVSSTVFGGIIEGIQYFLAHRSAEFMDLWADVLGTVVGIILCLVLFRGKVV